MDKLSIRLELTTNEGVVSDFDATSLDDFRKDVVEYLIRKPSR